MAEISASEPRSTNASHLTTGQAKIFVYPVANRRFCYGAREPSGSVLPARRGGLAAKIQRRDFP